eukprot:499072_1
MSAAHKRREATKRRRRRKATGPRKAPSAKQKAARKKFAAPQKISPALEGVIGKGPVGRPMIQHDIIDLIAFQSLPSGFDNRLAAMLPSKLCKASP